ncbi:ribonuclease H-like protein [Rhizodiscina lignyota]|uniref:Ribonuclease H-like protein n=1 Tax=Rhizodiscina lignyota TaxID=1504668 RepID=A0A9P4IBG5_9PEZI|nr:ribonuclease H-like protein [Rhizodiscina lignyota]
MERAPLSFQIPEEVLSRALHAPPGAQIAYWSHDIYRGPNGEKVLVHYCKSKATVEQVAQLFLAEPVVGFDIEWAPYAKPNMGPKANTSLIQLACENRIALLHIALHKGEGVENLVAPSLKQILESPDIVKTGVSIGSDCTRLEESLKIKVKGRLELSHLHKLVKYRDTEPHLVNKQLVSLARQVEEHLALPLLKGGVRTSDWSRELTHEQVRYAATDAYAGYRLFDVLERKRLSMTPVPPKPHFVELGLPIDLGKTVPPRETKKSDRSVGGVDSSDMTSSDKTPNDAATTCSSNRPDIEVPIPDEFNQNVDKVQPTKASPDAGGSMPTLSPIKAPEVEQAEAWIAEYEASLSPPRTLRASRTQLRAYALWQFHGLSVREAAAVLRDPPLKESTVASYIMEAIRVEQLDFKKERLLEVYAMVPWQALGMYRTLMSRLK